MTMTTDIITNGSGNAQPIETLFARLESDTLDPMFEAYGDFICYEDRILAAGAVQFWGNFSTYSHVFDVRTDDPDLIERLSSAIRRNQLTVAYKTLRSELIANGAANVKRAAEREQKRMADYRERMLRFG
jgi:hypothetical protein